MLQPSRVAPPRTDSPPPCVQKRALVYRSSGAFGRYKKASAHITSLISADHALDQSCSTLDPKRATLRSESEHSNGAMEEEFRRLKGKHSPQGRGCLIWYRRSKLQCPRCRDRRHPESRKRALQRGDGRRLSKVQKEQVTYPCASKRQEVS